MDFGAVTHSLDGGQARALALCAARRLLPTLNPGPAVTPVIGAVAAAINAHPLDTAHINHVLIPLIDAINSDHHNARSDAASADVFRMNSWLRIIRFGCDGNATAAAEVAASDGDDPEAIWGDIARFLKVPTPHRRTFASLAPDWERTPGELASIIAEVEAPNRTRVARRSRRAR